MRARLLIVSPFSRILAACLVALVFALASNSCTTVEPQPSTYFDRVISPVLTTSCVRTNTGAGCHLSTPKGNAFGNLDVSTFGGINKRRDLLADYGPYGQPALLVKNIPPFTVNVQSFDGTTTTVTTDIRHTGGPILDPTATGYQTIRRWINNGATENNSGVTPSNLERLPCSSTIGSDPSFNASQDPTTADFAQFRSNVIPVFKKTCAASNCHGTTSNELYLTCGDSPEQIRWNYFVASEYLAQTPAQSELVRRPLSPSQGGSFHEGGAIFTSVNDSDYQSVLTWATAHGPIVLTPADQEPEFVFFTHRVQPVLVKKGCMMLQCHSAAMFHDYRLRGGSGGSFSLSATKRNYALSLAQLSLESDDVNASRIVKKNLYRPLVASSVGPMVDSGVSATDGGTPVPNSEGLLHRGGPLLEDFGGVPANGASCDAGGYDYSAGDLDTIPAYCVIREWHRLERAARITSGELVPLSAIVYVKRSIPAGTDRAQDFEAYSPGSDLRMVAATMSATGQLTLAADTSVTTGCGLSVASADIKRPAVSWDGKKIAFAARSSATEALQIYEMNSDGSNCAKHADINKATAANGLLVHNFDPQYSPPDASGAMHLVFASTRGVVGNANFDYSDMGPTRTPADPSKLNADLYAYEPDPAAAGANRIRQLTFQLNLERYPSFMSDGRIIFDTEKRAPGLYQLALRRLNLDGGDYHPLFAQRGSIGYHEATQVVELAEKNFAAIFSEPGVPHQGGALGIFNRSIGIDFHSADPKDYALDPSVIDPNSATSPEAAFFLHSLSFPDDSVSGSPGAPTTGLYTSPAMLPNGKMLVSFGAATDAASFSGDYDVYVVNPVTGEKTKLFGVAGQAEIQAVGVFSRANKGVFASAYDEPNGHTIVYPGKSEAEITALDMPVLTSLLFQNTPTGRPVEDFNQFEIYEDMPPTPEVTSIDMGGTFVAKDDFGSVYVRRRLLGVVPILGDHSVKFRVPGGLPILLHVPDTAESKANKWPRFQREAMTFYPGEYVNQSFRREFFNGLCAQCHGAISGRQVDVAVLPDLLTQASNIAARSGVPTDLNLGPAQRGSITGPPATP